MAGDLKTRIWRTTLELREHLDPGCTEEMISLTLAQCDDQNPLDVLEALATFSEAYSTLRKPTCACGGSGCGCQ